MSVSLVDQLALRGGFSPAVQNHIPVTQSGQFWQVIFCLARPSGFPVASFQANLSPAEPAPGKAGAVNACLETLFARFWKVRYFEVAYVVQSM
jgi:hypothetical protein